MEKKQIIFFFMRRPYSVRAFVLSMPGLLILSGLVLFIGYRTFGLMKRERTLRSEIRTIDEQTHASENELEALRAELAYSRDPDAIERIAKEQLNLQKPGEEVAVVIPQSSNSAPPGPSIPFWKSFLRFFAGIGR